MALDFGKVAFSVSFDPTFAFPVDARSYFESYDAAVVAAASAKEAGSSESVYYYGQTLVVVENNKATFYIIQPDGTLSAINGSNEESTLILDENQFRFNDDGKLSLVGYEDASSGQVLTLGSDGKLIWSNPIDTYTKTEIDTKIAAAGHLKRVIVENKNEIINDYFDKADYDTYIFMISKFTDDSDKYDEYIIIDIDGLKTIERVGTWEVDLTKYATKEELDTKVDKHGNDRLITESEATKLANLLEGAEKNIINSVSSDFSINDDRQLNLNNLPPQKITGLEEVLKSGSRLITLDEINKLAALQWNNNDLQISGSVSASQISDLADWLNNNAGAVKGLSENNLTDDLYKQITEALYISEVDTAQLNVDNSGILSIKTISQSQVDGLGDALKKKADLTSLTNLETQLNSMSNKVNILDKHLTWQSLTDE